MGLRAQKMALLVLHSECDFVQGKQHFVLRAPSIASLWDSSTKSFNLIESYLGSLFLERLSRVVTTLSLSLEKEKPLYIVAAHTAF